MIVRAVLEDLTDIQEKPGQFYEQYDSVIY